MSVWQARKEAREARDHTDRITRLMMLKDAAYRRKDWKTFWRLKQEITQVDRMWGRPPRRA
jgi:hypothetical protein